MAPTIDDTIIKERIRHWVASDGYDKVKAELIRLGVGLSTAQKLLIGKYRWKLDLSIRYKIGNVLTKQL